MKNKRNKKRILEFKKRQVLGLYYTINRTFEHANEVIEAISKVFDPTKDNKVDFISGHVAGYVHQNLARYGLPEVSSPQAGRISMNDMLDASQEEIRVGLGACAFIIARKLEVDLREGIEEHSTTDMAMFEKLPDRERRVLSLEHTHISFCYEKYYDMFVDQITQN